MVVGERAHSTLFKSLGLVGLGRRRLTVVPADDQGRIRPDRLPDVAGPVLFCAQAGEVNTGAFDPFDEIADWVAERSGWLHVDGAFGLWALADPSRAHLVHGLDRADSWAADAHKWLNVTYDSGLVFVRDLSTLRRTFAAVAGYLPSGDTFDAMHHTPQSSQRARAVEIWSVLRTLGRHGVAGMVVTACDAASAIADRLAADGLAILNEVVLNQVLVRMVDGPTTEALVDEVQADGRIWCGPYPVGRSHRDEDQRLVVEDRARRRRLRRRRDPRVRLAGAVPIVLKTRLNEVFGRVPRRPSVSAGPPLPLPLQVGALLR